MITRLRFIWHHNTAASEPHAYCSSMAQMSVSRTTAVKLPPKLRRQGATRGSPGCCRSIRRVSKRCDIYRYNSSIKYLDKPISFVVFSYFMVLYSNFSFVTFLPKRTSPRRSEPCPHWEDCQGVTQQRH